MWHGTSSQSGGYDVSCDQIENKFQEFEAPAIISYSDSSSRNTFARIIWFLIQIRKFYSMAKNVHFVVEVFVHAFVV